jgi:VanZ family protein
MTMKMMLRVCSVVALVALVFVALAPTRFVPRSGLGWEIDHFVGYFFLTLLVCLAWPRPLVVGVSLAAFAVLLEGLQAFPPDRSSNVFAAIIGACGVLTAAVLAELFMRRHVRLRADANP